MFNLGDRVKHQETAEMGIVIGYGHRIVNNKCLNTVKVKITNSNSRQKTILKEPDFKWLLCQEDYRISDPNPLAHRFTKKPVKKYNFAESAQL